MPRHRFAPAALTALALAAALLPRPARAGLGDTLRQWIDRPGYQRSHCLAMQEGRVSYRDGLARLGIEPGTRANAHLYGLCRQVGAPFFTPSGATPQDRDPRDSSP